MRNFFTLILFLVALSINSQKNNKSPNIILIMADDLGSECLDHMVEHLTIPQF